MLLKVWKEVVKIQWNFLWGGLSKKNKTCWVKWSDICKPRKNAGLGIRDLRMVNLSLLAKWRWKLLSNNEEVWKEVVKAKYGAALVGNVYPSRDMVPRLSSKWWIDICNIDKDADWFSRAVKKKVGNGRFTKFWSDIWVGDQPLCIRFPRLYGISNQQGECIQNMGVLIDNRWNWNLIWRRNFFEWEEDLRVQLHEVIDSFMPAEREDSWLWRNIPDEGFTVNSCYELLCETFLLAGEKDPFSESVFSKVWKCIAPSKVCAFSWQLLLNRVQTKDNLWRRRMIGEHERGCVHCGMESESAVHLFLHCAIARKIWYALMKWLGLIIIIPPSLLISFAMFVEVVADKRAKKVLIAIWNATVWVLWISHNDCVFNNKVPNVEEMVDRIKLLSWKWFLSRLAKGPCLLYEWNWSPFSIVFSVDFVRPPFFVLSLVLCGVRFQPVGCAVCLSLFLFVLVCFVFCFAFAFVAVGLPCL
ncbi:hypothetical protein QL285_091613 [Trifolium repens]|nr:hypothetical protein QL285_091613 [Trifolium repens]